MFWATICPSSGETTIFATLGTCYSVWMTGMQGAPCIPDSHPYSITSTKCHKNSAPCIPDSHPYSITSTKCHKNSCFSWWWAHSCQKHVEIDKYSILRINCAPSWLYLQDVRTTLILAADWLLISCIISRMRELVSEFVYGVNYTKKKSWGNESCF